MLVHSPVRPAATASKSGKVGFVSKTGKWIASWLQALIGELLRATACPPGADL